MNSPTRPDRRSLDDDHDLIPKRRLYEEVAIRLEKMIYTGELPVGSPLPSERDLMERFGVGRPAVREALLWLGKKGLVSVSRGERTKVTEPDPRNLLQTLSGAARYILASPEGVESFQKTRLFVEVGIAREAARVATPSALRRLDSALDENRQSLGDLAEFERTDVLFHFVLTRICRNPILTALHDAILGWLYEQRHTSLKHPDAERLAFHCHQQIYEAVRRHDPDLAEREMRLHLEQVAKLYKSVKTGSCQE